MYSLKAELREKKEKVSDAGYISAILYGPEIKENILLKIKESDFKKTYREAGETSLIEIEINNTKYPVLVFDYQNDPMSGNFIHIDFYSPNLKEEVEAEVPVELKGIAPAVALGGTLNHNLKILHVKALPNELPHKIEVDVSSLVTFADVIKVSSIDFGSKVKIITNKDEVIASVVEVKAQVEEPKVETSAPETIANDKEETKEEPKK
ncbi:MAG: 50S ribosomal protein L25 [Candidatus Pacebacteria bacterium]|nr:50S ribosomal protein L25 [Candidatus Paceibacterota bacterium]MDD4333825.1 50S ribosomal protein L25 [Candidatus Paceibacterota bacterium]